MAATKFKTGAKPTPRWKLAAARPHIIRGGPPRPIVVPSFLEMWLNDQYGDCVSAEEAAAIAFYSVMCGNPETKITDSTVQAFCNKYGFLNGANLTDVMDKMISDGFQQDSGYKDGPYASVDFSNESALQDAINLGPVKIGIDASALPSGAGNGNGWYKSGGSPGQFGNEDHCVGLWNYGPAAQLFQALGVSTVPSDFTSPNGYHLYTWSSVGVVDHPWIMSTVGEAWIRNPTTVGVVPAPAPTPTPTPTPTPPPTPMPSTLQAAIDWILTEMAVNMPFAAGLIMEVKSVFDSWFAAHPKRAMAKVPVGGTIATIVDQVFADVEASLSGNPWLLFAVKAVQGMVDAWMAARGY